MSPVRTPFSAGGQIHRQGIHRFAQTTRLDRSASTAWTLLSVLCSPCLCVSAVNSATLIRADAGGSHSRAGMFS